MRPHDKGHLHGMHQNRDKAPPRPSKREQRVSKSEPHDRIGREREITDALLVERVFRPIQAQASHPPRAACSQKPNLLKKPSRP